MTGNALLTEFFSTQLQKIEALLNSGGNKDVSGALEKEFHKLTLRETELLEGGLYTPYTSFLASFYQRCEAMNAYPKLMFDAATRTMIHAVPGPDALQIKYLTPENLRHFITLFHEYDKAGNERLRADTIARIKFMISKDAKFDKLPHVIATEAAHGLLRYPGFYFSDPVTDETLKLLRDILREIPANYLPEAMLKLACVFEKGANAHCSSILAQAEIAGFIKSSAQRSTGPVGSVGPEQYKKLAQMVTDLIRYGKTELAAVLAVECLTHHIDQLSSAHFASSLTPAALFAEVVANYGTPAQKEHASIKLSKIIGTLCSSLSELKQTDEAAVLITAIERAARFYSTSFVQEPRYAVQTKLLASAAELIVKNPAAALKLVDIAANMGQLLQAHLDTVIIIYEGAITKLQNTIGAEKEAAAATIALAQSANKKNGFHFFGKENEFTIPAQACHNLSLQDDDMEGSFLSGSLFWASQNPHVTKPLRFAAAVEFRILHAQRGDKFEPHLLLDTNEVITSIAKENPTEALTLVASAARRFSVFDWDVSSELRAIKKECQQAISKLSPADRIEKLAAASVLQVELSQSVAHQAAKTTARNAAA